MSQKVLKLHLLTFILSNLIILISPLILIILGLSWLRKILTKFWSHHFCPEHGKILNSMASFCAGTDYPEMYESKTMCNVMVVQIADGHFDLVKFREQTLERVQTKIEGHGSGQAGVNSEYLYPELMQYVTSWLGYLFWCWDKNFKIENHVNLLTFTDLDLSVGIDPENFGEPEIPLIVSQLTSKPFKGNQSPWEVLLLQFQNDKLSLPPKYVAMLRFHHCLGDGFTVLKLLAGKEAVKQVLEAMSRSKVEAKTKDEGKHEWVTGSLDWIWSVFCFPLRVNYEAMYAHLEAQLPYDNWHLKTREMKFKLHMAISEPISVDLVKEVKRIYGTSFHCIVQAALTGGLRNFRLQRDGRVAEKFHCFLPLPVKGHPDKLRNHLTIAPSFLPIGIGDPRERVRSIDSQLRRLSKSTLPVSMLYTFKLWGCLPRKYLKLLHKVDNVPSSLLSNFPGPPSSFPSMWGTTISNCFFAGSGATGVLVTSLTCSGNLRICLQVDEAILPEQTLVQKLLEKIVEEFYVLKGLELV